MACEAIRTGEQFLAASLAHIDCQARTIGSLGFGALADPTSSVSLALTAMLTVFVALFGLRVMLSYPMAGRDVVGDILKVAIVLTLATSWPAWQIVGYDLIVDGPSEIAGAVGLASGLSGSAGDMPERLQRIDDAIVALNTIGSGRLGAAQGDWFQLGLSRIVYLVGTLGPLALLRLLAGINLAIAPLVAGLLLFGITRSLFIGWAKALVMTYLATIGLTLVLGVQLTIMEPWLSDVFAQRSSELQTLGAPSELLVFCLAFTLVTLGVVVTTAWLAFHPSYGTATLLRNEDASSSKRSGTAAIGAFPSISFDSLSRAERVASAVQANRFREDRIPLGTAYFEGRAVGSDPAAPTSGTFSDPSQRLGGSYRRGTRRVSAAGRTRDQAR